MRAPRPPPRPLPRPPGAFCAALALALAPPLARAAPPPVGGTATRRDWPCPGCLLDAPPAPAEGVALPLLVVLHGDEGGPLRVFAIWKRAAAEAGFLLLAPRCPREEGCAGSYWRWNGDPGWLLRQVDAVAAHYPVDPARVYLSGWSGGATYIGFQRGDFESRFAAINLSGGGSPPGGGAACAPCPAPVYYLMGDRNPLFASAVATRDFFKGCGHEVEWRLLPGADHGGELRAYSRPEQAASLLAWLSARPKRCPADPAADAGLGDAGRGGGDAGPAAGRDAPQAAESAAAPPAGKREVGTSGAIAEPRIGSRCVCGVAGARGSSGGPAGLAAAMMALLARRRRRVAAPGSRASRVPG